MSLTEVSKASSEEEEEIQKQIFKAIDDYDDIIFNAGAGSGKTHALIESLKYIIQNNSDRLVKHNQNIICITYTNVAVNEISGRLGNSELVQISTIHAKLWEMIKSYKKELLTIHKNKIKEELSSLVYDLNTNESDKAQKTFKAFRDLSPIQQDSFREYILLKKDVFYKNTDKSAPNFKAVFSEGLTEYDNILKSVVNFKKTVRTIFKIDNYRYCLEQIDLKNENYKIVKYDQKYNTDILHRMLISHDTLLEYALIIVRKYDLLKQVLVDSYPYILIDEYQDTNKNVIEIMQLLSTHSTKIKHKIFIAYFGDTAQNIYEDGVGHKIKEIHLNLKTITKKFNRRSNSEIINVINEIRDDDIEQKSIYSDAKGGSVEFYEYDGDNKDESIDTFIDSYRKEWAISKEKKLHCLVLTNKLVAKLSGFPDIYQFFANTGFYKINFDRVGTELLSHELTKLGEIPNLFYRLINFRALLSNPSTSISKLFNEDIHSKLKFSELKILIKEFQSITGSSFEEYLKSIFIKYEESTEKSHLREIINNLINLEGVSSYNKLFNYCFEKLFPNLDSDDVDKYNDSLSTINSLFQVELSQYELWHDFINDTQKSDVIYHTYHGTKGLEFSNLIIIMENDFGRMNKNKFSSFFKNNINPDAITEEKEILKFENTKNLLYVSCSRAVNNLRILYLDSTVEFQDGIKKIFSKINEC